jgi:hypothetical protein
MSATPSAQLGEVSRKEAERRKTVKTSGKTYTNDNLKPEPRPSPGPVASGDTASSAGPASEQPSSDAPEAATPPAAGAKAAPASPQTDEERKKAELEWRAKIKAERDALAKANSFADALQVKINALNTDFVNRDDPAQRSIIAAQREKALAELAATNKEIDQRTKAIATIQQDARRAGVPAAWVR